MDQELNYPKSENELRLLLDNLYQRTRESIESNELPRFRSLKEIIQSEAVILTSIHKIKANKGSMTAGVDGKTIRDFLEMPYGEVIGHIQSALNDYRPLPVRRHYIPKPGKPDEMRPLGIPVMIDRIVQDCVRTVLEPILEAHFFAHSYGFRPMRDAQMALERVDSLIHKTGYHWIVEGDISKFFDNVNHTILLKKLWHMGIRDRRVLMLIKQMLKAGVMEESIVNDLGTPQGGIISPLLANTYLHSLDEWITREWEAKRTRHKYNRQWTAYRAFKAKTRLKPAYLVRYADDWVLITDTKSNAEKWRRRIARYLDVRLKLKLSQSKTLITNLRNRPIHFVGFDFKVIKGSSRTGYITRSRPNKERLKAKAQELRVDIKRIRKLPDLAQRIHMINELNSKIRGVAQYYQTATWVVHDLARYADRLDYTAYRALKSYGGKWVRASELDNLTGAHHGHKNKVSAIIHDGMTIGITSFKCVRWVRPIKKNQAERPYTEEGRNLYRSRTGKQPLMARADELLVLHLSRSIARGLTNKRYNFEYFLNRAYAYNRDKGNCKVCGSPVMTWNVHIHHTRPYLPLDRVNRVKELATLHEECHYLIHDGADHSDMGVKAWEKIRDFREKLIVN